MGWLAKQRAQWKADESRLVFEAAQHAERTALAEANLAAIEIQRQRQDRLDDAITETIHEAVTAFQYNPGPLFDLWNYATADAISESDDHNMLRKCYKLYRTDPFVGGWIELFVKFVVGQGVTVRPREKDDAKLKQARKIIEQFRRGESTQYRNQQSGPQLEAEMVRRFFRDGRVGLRKYPSMDGKLYTRFLNPLLIRNNGAYGERGSFGIVTSQDDVQVIQLFVYHPYGFQNLGMPSSYEPTLVPGSEVIWVKNGDSDAKTGTPIVIQVLQYYTMFQRLMHARVKLNYLRSLCYKEEIYEGLSKAQIEKIHDGMKAAETSANASFEKVPTSGSVERHGSTVKVDYKTPNLQNSDAKIEFDMLGQAFAVWFCLPMGLIMADDDKETYRGGEIGERRAERTIEYWQYVQMAPAFRNLYESVLESAKSAGQYDGDTTVDIDMPIVNPKDIIKETQAFVLQSTTVLPDGRPICSAETARSKLGHDNQVEVELADNEKENAPEDTMAGSTQELAKYLKRAAQNTGSREGRQAVRDNGTNGS